MADFGGFLAGLLSGTSESYARASEDNRRIHLLKKQLETQKAIQEGQLALQGQQMSFQQQMAERGAALDERRAGQDDRRIGLAERAQTFNETDTREGRLWQAELIGLQDALQ